ELPAIAGCRRFAQRLQIGAVENVDTQDRLDEIVDRISGQITRGLRRIPGRFPDKQRDVAPFQPRKDRIIEPGRAVVRTELGTPSIAAPAQHQRVPWRHPDTRLLFPSLQILGEDAITRREIRYTLE